MKYGLRIALVLLSASATGWLLADDDSGNKGLPQVTHKAWQNECSSCHLAYHPGLLPARSWRSLMSGLDKHFGENAGLDAKTTADILAFLESNAADRNAYSRSKKINASIPANKTPLRITETAYFQRRHDELNASVWRRRGVGSAANCAACHTTAERGDFSERKVQIPR